MSVLDDHAPRPAGPTSWARRRARRRDDRRRRHELPRLPDPARRCRGDGAIDQFFDPWIGPLATRFAATFVLIAGVGVTLLTRSSIGDRAAVAGEAVDARSAAA